ncbi:hypothetical protein PIB30_044152 [Stylosanthes scabra]|uniref:Uncharacterized protein n=1 Tax=Stylosanthes scabra TaxID=79078 RepID=A0ABU6VIL6_9FABA|nr:hypothetical protein [Stylosanthes scabra]
MAEFVVLQDSTAYNVILGRKTIKEFSATVLIKFLVMKYEADSSKGGSDSRSEITECQIRPSVKARQHQASIGRLAPTPRDNERTFNIHVGSRLLPDIGICNLDDPNPKLPRKIRPSRRPQRGQENKKRSRQIRRDLRAVIQKRYRFTTAEILEPDTS